MGHYSKDGNIVTLTKIDKSGTVLYLIGTSFFWIPFAMAGFVLLYVLIFENIKWEYTEENFSTSDRILFFLFLDIPFLFISYAIISGFVKTVKDLIHPNSFKIDINTKVCTFENSRLKSKILFEADSFKQISYDLIFVNRGEDDDYYIKLCFEGDDAIVYLVDRNGSGLDGLDLKYVSNYLGIPLLRNDTRMQDEEYKIFRKQEVEDIQNDTRQKYYL